MGNPSPKRQKISNILLEELPDEIVLKILSYLNITHLICCSQLSKRFAAICLDESLWQKINLYKSCVPSSVMSRILNNGCKYLSLDQALIDGRLDLKSACKLEYLDFGECYDNYGVVRKLLTLCTSLKKLSLRNKFIYGVNNRSKFEGSMLTCIKFQNYQTLTVLDLRYCKGFDLTTIQHIVNNFVGLEELNLSYTDIFKNRDLIRFLVNNLTEKVTKLGLCLNHYHTYDLYFGEWDEHVDLLVTR